MEETSYDGNTTARVDFGAGAGVRHGYTNEHPSALAPSSPAPGADGVKPPVSDEPLDTTPLQQRFAEGRS